MGEKNWNWFSQLRSSAADRVLRRLLLRSSGERRPAQRGLTWHTLHDTFAGLLVMRGVNLKTVQEPKGHKFHHDDGSPRSSGSGRQISDLRVDAARSGIGYLERRLNWLPDFWLLLRLQLLTT